MNLKLLLGLMLLFLTACGTSPVRDDSPANDLDALANSVKSDAEPRTLPNGKTYCVEDAGTNKKLKSCALNLEDGFFLSEGDKARILDNVLKAVERMKLARNPCRWWQVKCRAREEELNDGPD